MGKRKRDELEEDDYLEFCNGLQQSSNNGKDDTSYIYSCSRPYKRPKINPNFHQPGEVQYRYLDSKEKDYKVIEKLIKSPVLIIDDIVEVKNSMLENAYNFKKKEKEEAYKGKIEEALLFHGTKESKVRSICRFNFDWRLNGSNRGHKFGKGVCFSRSARYASNYSDYDKHFKVMIVAKVLIGKVCPGHHDMTIPPQGYDTSQKTDGKGSVLVKYEDNEFFPAYILYYHFREYETQRYSYYQDQNSYFSGSYWNSRGNNYNSYQYEYRNHSGGQPMYCNVGSYYFNYKGHYITINNRGGRPITINSHGGRSITINSHDYSRNWSDYSSDGHYGACNNYWSFN